MYQLPMFMRDSMQARVVLVVGLLSVLYSSLYKSKVTLTVVLFMLAALALKTYAVNCLVRGNCDTYAWVLVVFYVLTVLMMMNDKTLARMQ